MHWLFWGSYFTLLWSRQLVETVEGWRAGGTSTWGDGAAHLTYMSTFAFRDKFPLQHPLFWGVPFSYAFGADWLGGVLVRSGMSLFLAYSFLGLALSLVLVWLMFEWFKWLWKSDWVALIGSALFLWSGGLGWWWFIKDVASNGLVATIAALPREYTHWEEKGIFWINTVSSELLPQRAFLLGMSVGIIVLWWLMKGMAGKENRRLWFLGAGILTGLMPIIHAHTGVVVGMVAGWWWINNWWARRDFRSWVWFWVPVVVVGGMLTKIFIWSAISESFFRFWPGWLTNPQSQGGSWVWFWVKNWGVFGVAAIWGWFGLKKDKRRLLAPFVALWVVANLWLFQPWDWDNSKMFTWVYLMLAGVVAGAIVKLGKKGWWGKLAGGSVFVLATWSGMLDTARLLQWNKISLPLVSYEEVQLANQVRERTLPQAVFLTADQHNHFVPMLTGRQIVMGFKGWMWSYGLPYQEREEEVRVMFTGAAGAEKLLKKYGVDYVVVGPAEIYGELKANEKWFAQRFPVAFRSEKFRIYQVGY